MALGELAEGLLADEDLRSEIERLRVASLRSLMTGEAMGETTFNVARLQRNLVLLSRAIRREVRRGVAHDDTQVQRAALFLARSYEQLATQSSVDSTSILMAAAINYEIAGFQANAATLARMACDIRLLGTTEAEPDFHELSSLFLQRRFLRCALPSYLPDKTEHEGDLEPADLLAAARHLTSEGLASASRYFLNGQSESLGRAAEDLEIAHEALLDLGAAPQANLVGGLRALLPRLEQTSTWTYLFPKLPDSRLWQRYLKALGRGIGGTGPLDARSISELWPSQLAALNGGLLEGGSRVLRMPTSAGKTRVAEMAIVHCLGSRPGARALYVAPFNALTNEVSNGFNDLFVDLGLSLSSLTGNYEVSASDDEPIDDDLLVLTPEKLDQLLRSDSAFLDEVDVVVLDEGHVVGEENRGPKYELVISRLRQRRPEAKFLALSAVVPDETLVEFSEWLRATEQPISSAWRPTVVRLAKLEWRNEVGDLVYPAEHDELVVPSVVQTQTLEHRHPSTGRLRRPRFPEGAHRAQVAAALAWEMIEHGGVLIYCSTPDYAQSVAGALAQRVEYAELRDERIPPPLTSIGAPRSVLVAEEWLGPDHKVTQQLRRGIGVHFAALPAAVKAAIEEDFRDRRLSVLAATPTLAQGVNLPIRTLIVHTTRRYDEALNEQIAMPARDFWNIAGRVGRAGAETEGTVVFLSFNRDDDSDFQYFAAARDTVERVTSALHRMLSDLVADRISASDIARQLDPEMLALLVEEQERALTPEGLQEALGSTLFHIQSTAAKLPTDRMWNLMANTARVISQAVDDVNRRKVFATTGLSARSCLAIQEHIETNTDAVRAAFAGELPESAVVELLLSGLSRCREMVPRTAIDGSHEELLAAWITGRTVTGLASDFDQDSVRLTKFIEDYFGYRLPWGLSGYMRIAQGQLELDQLPPHLEELPLKIRFGVPSVVASWVMALGVASRGLAVTLAVKYSQSTTNPTPAGLRRWLSGLEVESVIDELGLAASSLPAVRQVALRAHGNRLLKDYFLGQALLPCDFNVTLRRTTENEDVLAALGPGDWLEVRRDYDGAHRNSLEMYLGQSLLARIPRRIGDAIALEVDAGLRVRGQVQKSEAAGDEKYRIGVRLMPIE